MKKIIFTILISLIIIFFFYYNYTFFLGGDFQNHFYKAKDINCKLLPENIWNKENCAVYAPLSHFLGSIFSFHERNFVLYSLIINAFLVPLTLYFLSGRDEISTIFYFTVTNYFFYFTDGIIAQSLTNLFGLGIFLTPFIPIQLFLILLMSFSHGHGLLLGIFLFFCKNYSYLLNFKGFLAGCSGTFGNHKPLFLEETIGKLGGSNFFIADFLHHFTKKFPFFFYFISLREYFLQKKYDFFLAMIGFTIFSFFVSSRVFYLVPLFGIPGLVWFYRDQKPSFRYLILLLVFLIGFYQWFSFFSFKACHDFLLTIF